MSPCRKGALRFPRIIWLIFPRASCLWNASLPWWFPYVFLSETCYDHKKLKSKATTSSVSPFVAELHAVHSLNTKRGVCMQKSTKNAEAKVGAPSARKAQRSSRTSTIRVNCSVKNSWRNPDLPGRSYPFVLKLWAFQLQPRTERSAKVQLNRCQFRKVMIKIVCTLVFLKENHLFLLFYMCATQRAIYWGVCAKAHTSSALIGADRAHITRNAELAVNFTLAFGVKHHSFTKATSVKIIQTQRFLVI